MAKRTRFTALVGALLVGFLLLISVPVPLCAHTGHNHGSKEVAAAQLPAFAADEILSFAASGEGTSAQATDPLRPATVRDAANDLTRARAAETPQPLSEACCCGSIACHVGVSAPIMNLFHPYRLGQRMRPAAVLGAAKAVQGGIERPPRAPIPALGRAHLSVYG
jgi:hypothetical protein